MADPIKFTPGYSYTVSVIPNFPGTRFDQDFMNLETSIDTIVDAIKDVRRSDGKLKNAIVTLDSLDPQVAAGVGAGALASAEAAAGSAIAANVSAEAAAGNASAAFDRAAAAAGYATAALGYSSTALVYRNEAGAERTGAQMARDFAAAWATAVSGVDVNDGVNPVGKSAYHWAQVALGAATGALPDNSVSTSKLVDGAVTRAKLAGAVTDELDDKADAAATATALANRLRVDAAQSFSDPQKGQALANLGLDYDALKWLSKAVGELYAVDTSLPGVDIPPINDPRFRYVELTAGKTGAGSYNNGAMDTEMISGSAPLVNATAVVRLAGSPLVNTGIRLINTERRFLRPGSAGALQDDAMEQHFHSRNTAGANEVTVREGTGYTDLGAGTTRQLIVTPQTGLVASAHRTSTETRPRNVGATYYMRIK
jgi:hypothetical protein